MPSDVTATAFPPMPDADEPLPPVEGLAPDDVGVGTLAA